MMKKNVNNSLQQLARTNDGKTPIVYMEDDERRPMLLTESIHMNYAFDIRSNDHTPVCFTHST